MKANVLYNINDLRYVEYPTPILDPGEVLIKVRACGICGSDINRVYKTGTYHFPTIIGHEFAGEIVSVREDESSLFPTVGTRVGVFPLIPCKKCVNCEKERYEMCQNYNYLGSRTDGGFAEYVAVPRWNLIALDDSITYEQAAMLEPSAVALHALKQFKDIEDKTLTIIGPGTIGNLLVLIAKSLGVNQIIVIGRNDEKLNISKSLGADFIINMTKSNPTDTVKEITNSIGADICIEGTGVSSCIELAISVTRSAGEIVLMGNPQGDVDIEKNLYWQILRRQLTIHGTWNSSFGSKNDDWKEILNMMQLGIFDPTVLITHRFPLSGLEFGLNIARDSNIMSNKIMINND